MPTRDGTGPDHEELLSLWSARRTGVFDALTTTAGTHETRDVPGTAVQAVMGRRERGVD
jgi:hypothetical protein